jgi:hypothetical protein
MVCREKREGQQQGEGPAVMEWEFMMKNDVRATSLGS